MRVTSVTPAGGEQERLEISLVPAPDDISESAEHQQALRQVSSVFKRADPAVRELVLMRKSADMSSVHMGGFFIQYLAPAGIAAVTAWLVARIGRKVRIKVGDVEAEAATIEEVQALLKAAKQYREDEK